MNSSLLQRYLDSPEFERKLNHRLERLQLAEANPIERLNIISECTDDVFSFIDMFGVVYEPRNSSQPDIPMFLFPHQREVIYKLLEAEANQHDFLIEKTRDMMVTWTVLWYLLWRWWSQNKWYCRVGSRKEDEVDNSCYSEDTEVLTKNGWKLFKDVDINKDLFATRNTKTKEFEWQKANDKTWDPYEGDFYHIKSRTLDLLVSPHHRVLYRNNPWELIKGKYENKEHIKPVEELFKRGNSLITIPATSIWKGKEIDKFTFLKKGKRSKEIIMKGDDFCAFMGMWIAEGYKIKDGFAVAQCKKSKGYNSFKHLLIRIFGKEPVRNNDSWLKGSKPIFDYIQQFGHAKDKFIPSKIMNATPRQLGIFLHYYMLGDGSWKTSQPSMSTVSHKLANQLQEIIQKLGFSSSISTYKQKKDSKIGRRIIKKENCLPTYVLRIRTSRYQTIKIEKTHYKGYIGCVSVPNTILYVRRNGKPAWCGNTPQSLFGKIRYGFYSIPKWVRPNNFRKSEHDLHLKFINPDRQSYIDGESANPDFARGGRFSIIFMDEIFSWKFGRESWRSCGDSTPCRIAVSTAKPTSFARNLRSMFSDNGHLLTLDWHQHPFKDEEWYKQEQARRSSDSLSIEGELEISYLADPELAYYPEVLKCPVIDFDYNPVLPLFVGCDFGVQDKTSFVYFQKDANNFYCIDGFEKNHRALQWYYPFLKKGIDFDVKPEYTITNKNTKEVIIIKKTDYLKTELDLIKRFNSWNAPIGHFGEVAHRQRMIKSNTSIVSELAGLGIILRINDLGVAHSVRRETTKRMLKTTRFSSRYGGLDVYDAIVNSRFPKSRQSTVDPKDQPVHDEWADLRSAVENFACNQAFSLKQGIKSYIYHKM